MVVLALLAELGRVWGAGNGENEDEQDAQP
jgi:hypothetical protein